MRPAERDRAVERDRCTHHDEALAARILPRKQREVPHLGRSVGETSCTPAEESRHPKAQTKSMIEPDSVADDFGWKAIPDVAGSASFHPVSVPAAE